MKKLLFGLLLLNSFSYADEVKLSTTTLEEVKQKVVLLEITFAPTSNAEIKKQRKSMTVKNGKALCSGALVSHQGLILTAKHCAEGSTEIMAMLNDGQEYTAIVKGISHNQDLALLQIGRFDTPYFNFGQRAKQNQTVWIVGNPLGLLNLVTQGIVAKLYGDQTLLDCTAVPGNSGGPVINSKGELVGILTAMIMVEAGPSHITIAQSLDSILMFAYELTGGR